jgi:hypothetical protein
MDSNRPSRIDRFNVNDPDGARKDSVEEHEFAPPLDPSRNGAAHHDPGIPSPIEERERSRHRLDLGMAIDALTRASSQRRAHGQLRIELRTFSADRRDVRRLYVRHARLEALEFDEMFRLGTWLDDVVADEWNVGAVINAHSELSEGESANWERTTGVVAFWVEVVLGDVGADRLREGAEQLIRRSPLPPTEVVSTGTGVNLFWYVNEVVLLGQDAEQRREAFAEMQRRIQEHAWGLPVRTPNQARREGILQYVNALGVQVAALMRLPGTWNFRSDPPQRCEIVSSANVTYSVAEIQAAFPPPGGGPPASSGMSGDGGGDEGPPPRHPSSGGDAPDRVRDSTSGEGCGHAAADGGGPAGQQGVGDAPKDSANCPTRRRARRWAR